MNVIGDIAEFIAAEGPRLRRFLRRFGPSVSAEDIAQDSFARLLAADGERVVSPRAYLFKTARNLAIDQVRRQRASPVRAVRDLEAIEETTTAPSPEDALVSRETAESLQLVLAELNEDERLALLWRKAEGRSPQEIALHSGISVRQVQRLIARALGRCQASLRQADDNLSAER